MKHVFKEVVLNNGSRGLLIDVPGSTVANMEFAFLSGFDFIEPTKYEVPHSMEHMIFGANSKFSSSKAFSREIGLNGAYHNAYTSDYLNGYVAESPMFEWQRVMSLLLVGLTTPKFKPSEFKTEQETISEELHSRLDDDSVTLWVALAQSMGYEHMQDYPTRIKLLKNITPSDLRAHHQLTHTAQNMRFIIAGNLRGHRTKLIQTIEQFSSQLPQGERKQIPGGKLIQPLGPTVINRAADKTYFEIKSGFYGELTEKQGVGLILLRYLLTGAWDSRIFGKGRSKGLLYSIQSYSDSSGGVSMLSISGSVVPEKSKALFTFIGNELVRLKARGITQAELRRAQQYLIGDFQISHQMPQHLVNWYGRYLSRDMHYSFFRRPELIKSLTKHDINELVNQFFASETTWGVGVLAQKADGSGEDLYKQGERIWA